MLKLRPLRIGELVAMNGIGSGARFRRRQTDPRLHRLNEVWIRGTGSGCVSQQGWPDIEVRQLSGVEKCERVATVFRLRCRNTLPRHTGDDRERDLIGTAAAGEEGIGYFFAISIGDTRRLQRPNVTGGSVEDVLAKPAPLFEASQIGRVQRL